MISVRNVWACSSLAGCLRALMVSVPSGPKEDVTEVGSTSSGSWHLWVNVFITVPSVASCTTNADIMNDFKLFEELRRKVFCLELLPLCCCKWSQTDTLKMQTYTKFHLIRSSSMDTSLKCFPVFIPRL